MQKMFRVAIIGSGNIGTDLLHKVIKSPKLECTLFIGRRENSPGILHAKKLGIHTDIAGTKALITFQKEYDLVFDATSAEQHKVHAQILEKLHKKVIDLTPSKIGRFCVPSVNAHVIDECNNFSMITCGGQVAVPLSFAVSKIHSKVSYIEIITSLASKSAGMATRENLDNYILTTESAVKQFSKCKNVKAMLILNPAEPCIAMNTTLYAKVDNPQIEELKKEIVALEAEIKRFTPGYEIICQPTLLNQMIVMTAQVKGCGDFMPEYAGNLDIINCSAIRVAEYIAERGALE